MHACRSTLEDPTNLLAIAPDDDTLAEQVEITVLHELGHFFGLDEDDVAELGLE